MKTVKKVIKLTLLLYTIFFTIGLILSVGKTYGIDEFSDLKMIPYSYIMGFLAGGWFFAIVIFIFIQLKNLTNNKIQIIGYVLSYLLCLLISVLFIAYDSKSTPFYYFLIQGLVAGFFLNFLEDRFRKRLSKS